MKMDFALRIYWGRDEQWEYQDFEDLPVGDPCVMVIHLPQDSGSVGATDLLERLRWLVGEIGGQPAQTGQETWKVLPMGEAYWLHVLVSDGVNPVGLDEEALKAVRASDRAWVLPVLAESTRQRASSLLQAALKAYNAIFWQHSLHEVAQVLLARAGVTSLDRRVFISYRQPESSPIADQLYDELNRRNFQVFLDRVSIDPGVDFQAKLFEHLADKSMVVMLLSKTFSDSPWTRQEIEFARERRLSVIILRLPDAATDQLDGHLTHRGEVMELQDSDLDVIAVPGFAERQPRLRPAPLKKAVNEIASQHDKELIARLRDLRERVLEAARDQPGVKCTTFKNSGAVLLEFTSTHGEPRLYSLHPSAYPPGVPEMFSASTRLSDLAARRVVVGNTANLLPLRVKHLEWVVDGRNVSYHDVMTLRSLLDGMATGAI